MLTVATLRQIATTVSMAKKEVVEKKLLETEGKSSDRWYAERCNTIPAFVGKIRAIMEASGRLPKVEKRVGEDGRRRGRRRTRSEIEADERLVRIANLKQSLVRSKESIAQEKQSFRQSVQWHRRRLRELIKSRRSLRAELAKLDSKDDAP